MNSFSKLFSINKYVCLCHFTILENFHNKIYLLFWFALHIILVNMIKLKFLWFYIYLLCTFFINNFGHSFLYSFINLLIVRGVSCREQKFLYSIFWISLCNVFVWTNSFKRFKVFNVLEKCISFVNHNTFYKFNVWCLSWF